VYISDLDLIKQKLTVEGKLNQSEIIKIILNDAETNIQRLFMAVGERYYVGEQDILGHDFRRSEVYDTTPADESSDGKEHDTISTVINKNNSNMHNVHNFHKLLVDQKVAYIAGKAPTIAISDTAGDAGQQAYQNALMPYTTGDDFPDTLTSWIQGAANKGIEWLQVYYDLQGNLQYSIVPGGEVIAFYDSSHQKSLEDIVRFYMFDVVTGSQTVKRHKIEWWTAQDVTYYVEDEQGNYLLDPTFTMNPMPHWFDVTSVDGMVQSQEAQNWGRVPFIPLHNNDGDFSDLGGEKNGHGFGIKSLIDAYNMISSTSTNNQIDLVELYWVIQGYGGEIASQVAKKLQINKAITVDADSSGQSGVTAQQITLSVDERVNWLNMLRSDIFRLGQGIDIYDDSLGNDTSGAAIAFHYEPLDEKANVMILKLKKALKELFWYFTEDINRKQGTQYDSSKVTVAINKSRITNDLALVQLIMQSRGLVPDNLLLAAHPLVDDVNQAIKDMAEQQKQQDQRRSQIFGNNDVPPQTQAGDTGGDN
jgi:SPP1 family phage portal protein